MTDKKVIVEWEKIMMSFEAEDIKTDSNPYFRFKVWHEGGLIYYGNRLTYSKERILKLRHFFNSIELPEEEENE